LVTQTLSCVGELELEDIEMSTTPESKVVPSEALEIVVGVVFDEFVPSPNCPKVLFPQHCAAPLITAQVAPAPTATSVTPDVAPKTATGANRVVVVPSPSWP
jgi:hypothetical protein